ncbi:hypothetical protein ACH5RR_018237 [Cinchona calisaya]|uniref:Uncharacterized protein n=1 Tax=Cinchona calisaya TaxID=153742 RepID=A0ABD2ZM65_9GENT
MQVCPRLLSTLDPACYPILTLGFVIAKALVELCSNPKITEKEATILVDNDMLQDDIRQKGELCLLAKVISVKQEEDHARVLKGASRAFDQNLVVLAELNAENQPSLLEFHCYEFLVPIYDLPLGSMNKRSVKLTNNRLGRFVTVDVDECDICLGEYMRTKISIDVRAPLLGLLSMEFGGRVGSMSLTFYY